MSGKVDDVGLVYKWTGVGYEVGGTQDRVPGSGRPSETEMSGRGLRYQVGILPFSRFSSG